MSLRIQDQYILPFFIFPLHSRYFSFTNPSLRIQRQEFKNETVIKNSRSFFIFPLHSRYFSFTNPSLRIQRQEFKNETVIKNSRSFFIFLLHSRYFSFRNEHIIKNSRTNPSSRIQHHQEFTRLRECKTGTKNEPIIKNSRTNPSSRIQDKGTRLRM